MKTSINKILEQRKKTHGDFNTHAQISQELKAVLWKYNYQDLTPQQCESLEMICHKIARILNGNPNHKDHWDDVGGYAALISNELE